MYLAERWLLLRDGCYQLAVVCSWDSHTFVAFL